MKYLLILVGIIATITYLFVSGPKAISGRAEASVDRRQAVWDRVAQLEAGRRDMLIRAKGRGIGLVPPERAGRGGPWTAGYREGYAQGYSVGRSVAARQPNPRFFALNP